MFICMPWSVSLGDFEDHLEMDLARLARSRLCGFSVGCIYHCCVLRAFLPEPLFRLTPGLKQEGLLILSG